MQKRRRILTIVIERHPRADRLRTHSRTHWPPGGWGFHPYSESGQGGQGAKPLSGPLVSRASRSNPHSGRGAHPFTPQDKPST